MAKFKNKLKLSASKKRQDVAKKLRELIEMQLPFELCENETDLIICFNPILPMYNKYISQHVEWYHRRDDNAMTDPMNKKYQFINYSSNF